MPSDVGAGPHGIPAALGTPGPESARTTAALAAIRRRGDWWMRVLVGLHLALAVLLAPVHGTWTAALLVGGGAAAAFALAAWRRPGSRLARGVAGVALQLFGALHLHQMHGLPEMHFFYFTAVTAMIIYQDWVALWPGMVGVAVWHLGLAALHNAGVHPVGARLFLQDRVAPGELALRVGIGLLQAVMASYWAWTLERRTRRESDALARASQDEQRMRAILDGTFQIIGLLDPDGTVREVNHAALAFFGAERREIVGQRLADALWWFGTTDAHDTVQRATARAAAGRFARFEITLAGAGDRRVTLDGSLAPLFDDEGAVTMLVVEARDITERKAAEERLRASEARYRLLFESSPRPAWVYDLETLAFLAVNPAAERHYGWSAAEFATMTLRDVRPDEDRDAVVAWTREAGDRARSEHLRRHRTRDGRVIQVQLSSHALVYAGRRARLVLVDDVTERQRLEEALRASERFSRSVLDNSPDCVKTLDLDGRLLTMNGPGLCLNDIDDFCAVQGTDWPSVWPDGGDVTARAAVADAAAGTPARFQAHNRTAKGALKWWDVVVTPIPGDDGAPTSLLCVSREITETRHAQAAVAEREQRFRGVLENLSAFAVTLDARGHVTFVNDFALQVTGWSRDEVVGDVWFDRFSADPEARRAAFAALLAGGTAPGHHENEVVTRDGARRLVLWDDTLLRDAQGTVVGMASIGWDVTDQRRAERALRELSVRDELTGLLNRRGFTDAVTPMLKGARRTGRRDALLYLDLDDFKPINDAFGHAEGDAALGTIARLLRETVREGDLVARLGGDEFVVYAPGLAFDGEGHAIAARLVAALDQANAAGPGARPYRLAFSVGVAESSPADDLPELLARADAALYATKAARRPEVAAA